MLKALILTIVIECAVLFLLGERDKLFYLYWAAVTAFTNLIINFCIYLLFDDISMIYWVTVAFLEILVFFSEFLLCYAYSNNRKQSLKYSAVCNVASFGIGLIFSFVIKI